jgi:hypothetical protein
LVLSGIFSILHPRPVPEPSLISAKPNSGVDGH